MRVEATESGVRSPAADHLDTLDVLDRVLKARANLARSCQELRGLTPAEAGEVRALLATLIEERKRVRLLKRLWRESDRTPLADGELLALTQVVLSACRRTATSLDRWRSRSLEEVELSWQATWGGPRAAAPADRPTAEVRWLATR